MKRSLPPVLLALVAALSACSFEPVSEPVPVATEWHPGAIPCPGHPPTFNPDFTAAEWPEAAARAFCDRGVDCCAFSVSAYEACVERERRSIAVRSLEARIAAGLVTVDLKKARECLEAYAADNACTLPRRVLSCVHPALGVVRPAVEAGGDCIDHGDCTTGVCVRAPGACGGVCAHTAEVGEACDPSKNPCAPTGWCPPPGGPERRCLPRSEAGKGCRSAEACVKGTWCGGGVCRRFLEAGEPCEERRDRCVDGLSCIGGVCAREGFQPVGAPCDETEDCAAGLRCERETLRCARVEIGTTRCTSGADCSDIGFCHPQGWCAPRRAQHQPCEHGGWCMVGLICEEGACRPPADGAQRCDANADCRYPLTCREGRCGLPGAIGEGCRTASDCETARCLEGRCAPLLRAGESCLNGAECESKVCTSDSDGRRRCEPSCLP